MLTSDFERVSCASAWTIESPVCPWPGRARGGFAAAVAAGLCSSGVARETWVQFGSYGGLMLASLPGPRAGQVAWIASIIQGRVWPRPSCGPPSGGGLPSPRGVRLLSGLLVPFGGVRAIGSAVGGCLPPALVVRDPTYRFKQK